MRKLVLSAFVLCTLLACNQDVKEENVRLQTENEELMSENQQKDSLINDFVTSFTRIQENLMAIREKEERIQTAREGNLETSLNQREEVIRDIEVINELLSENRQTIANLNDKLKRYSYENSKFKKMVSDLQRQVETKDSQVVVLKENLAAINFEMESLNSKLTEVSEENTQRQQRIAEQQEVLNTAYYAVGTFDELEENKVIDSKGGFIGLGRTKTLATDFNRDYFTKIDITKTNQIPLNLEDDDVKLVSIHPTESYRWNKTDGKVNSLEITNPELFWKSSKYLVVLVD